MLKFEYSIIYDSIRRYLGSEGAALMHGISALIEETPPSALAPFHPMRTQQKVSRRASIPELNHVPAYRAVRYESVLFIII